MVTPQCSSKPISAIEFNGIPHTVVPDSLIALLIKFLEETRSDHWEDWKNYVDFVKTGSGEFLEAIYAECGYEDAE